MDCSRVYSGSDVMSLLDNSSNSIWVPSSSPSFHETMVNFDQEIQQGRRRTHRTTSDGEDGGGDEFEANGLYQPEKKRRLTQEQVQFLEKSFEVENKLEPERKVQLAKELGLQPRQVAIWFQNRRARYKTKQLEKDYDSLKASYDSLKLDYDSLIKEKDHLQNEVKLLTKKLKQGDTGRAIPDPDNRLNSEPNPKIETQKKPKMEMAMAPPRMKQVDQDASSAKSDVFDSESPHCTEGIHSSMLDQDPTDSTTHLPDPDLHSDFSQDEEDRHLMMSKSLLYPTTTTGAYNNNNNGFKVEEGFYDINNAATTTTTTTCNNFSFVVDDQHVWSWLY